MRGFLFLVIFIEKHLDGLKSVFHVSSQISSLRDLVVEFYNLWLNLFGCQWLNHQQRFWQGSSHIQVRRLYKVRTIWGLGRFLEVLLNLPQPHFTHCSPQSLSASFGKGIYLYPLVHLPFIPKLLTLYSVAAYCSRCIQAWIFGCIQAWIPRHSCGGSWKYLRMHSKVFSNTATSCLQRKL